jgi:nicotinate phosphoribosyltransferase
MIIKSILDLDLYKITMQYAVMQLFPTLKVRYTFKNRNKTPFPENFDIDTEKDWDLAIKLSKVFMQ